MPHHQQDEVFEVIPEVQRNAHLTSVEEYERVSLSRGCAVLVLSVFLHMQMYKQSLEDPDTFWREQAKTLDWFQPFTQVQSGYVICCIIQITRLCNIYVFYRGFAAGDVAWFLNGKINVSYNCIDRHLPTRADKVNNYVSSPHYIF